VTETHCKESLLCTLSSPCSCNCLLCDGPFSNEVTANEYCKYVDIMEAVRKTLNRSRTLILSVDADYAELYNRLMDCIGREMRKKDN
jgi:hypothetical protein